MAALSAPLRAPFARQFQGAPTTEVGGFGNGVAVTDRRMENTNEWQKGRVNTEQLSNEKNNIIK